LVWGALTLQLLLCVSRKTGHFYRRFIITEQVKRENAHVGWSTAHIGEDRLLTYPDFKTFLMQVLKFYGYSRCARFIPAKAKGSHSLTINTEASPNQNGLNPNVTVGSLAMAMAAPGYGGPVPLRTAKAMLAGAAGWVQGEVLPLSAGGTTPDNLFCNLRWPYEFYTLSTAIYVIYHEIYP
jgi:hypothetical protein